jgi:hypothetical protein
LEISAQEREREVYSLDGFLYFAFVEGFRVDLITFCILKRTEKRVFRVGKFLSLDEIYFANKLS